METLPVTLTETAKQRILKLAGKQDAPVGLILGIARGKGCGGNEYEWGSFVTEAPANHMMIPVNEGFAIYVPTIDSFNMYGMTIDYGIDETQKGVGSENFKFVNPNETGRCGCGVSVTFRDQPNP